MAKKHKQDEEVLVDVTQSISKLEQFFEDNRQGITIAAVAIFAIVAGYIGYIKFYQEPLEAEAQQEIYHAQRLFEADSLNEAVNGFNEKPGFLDIAADYSSTEAGNLANYYAGVCFLRLGQFKEAIEVMDDFHTNNPVLEVIAKGSIGDAFMELDQKEEALSYYKKAVAINTNDYVVPFYLLKAGLVAEEMEDYSAANEFYTRIKTDFGTTRQGTDIERYISRTEAKL
jgi:tetratricopeptide (TPR) repeat protein